MDDDEPEFTPFERMYEDEHSWEQLKEDEFGNLLPLKSIAEHQARRKRLLSAATSERIRRGMIRYVNVIVDLSRAASLTDMRPIRSAAMFGALKTFIRRFFNDNPLSQMGIIVLRNGIAEQLTELSSSPEVHIERLRQNLETSGAASLQNGLTMAIKSLSRIPPYGNREVLVILAALSTCDPGNIMETIAEAKAASVRVSVVGLAAEVHVCRVAATQTNGSYEVALGDAHLEELVLAHAIPPPAPPGSSKATLVRMGFPARAPLAPGTSAFVGHGCVLQPGSYTCPQCKARVEELPAQCHICQLTLVSAPHLARSYHHLFPIKIFVEASINKDAVESCFGCFTEMNTSQLTDISPAYRCPDCSEIFCGDCDVFIHEHLHSCPGCESRILQNVDDTDIGK